jgi:D-xylose transport system ATP-binding protein
MFLGRENVQRLVPLAVEPLSELKMEKRALEVLDGLHVTTIGSVRTPVASLSGGQRQSVAISRAVMWNSKLVILDEPTAALGVAQTALVIALIKRLRVFEVADRIIVLRLGRRVATFKHDETTPEEVVAAITGARREAA